MCMSDMQLTHQRMPESLAAETAVIFAADDEIEPTDTLQCRGKCFSSLAGQRQHVQDTSGTCLLSCWGMRVYYIRIWSPQHGQLSSALPDISLQLFMPSKETHVHASQLNTCVPQLSSKQVGVIAEHGNASYIPTGQPTAHARGSVSRLLIDGEGCDTLGMLHHVIGGNLDVKSLLSLLLALVSWC